MMISTPLSRRVGLFGLAASVLAFYRGGTAARAAPALSRDLVVLTAGGLVASPNRGPFDAARDHFFEHNNLTFDKARTFTAAELSGFPQKSVSVRAGEGERRYKGPLLRDVLAAAAPSTGAAAVRLFALDGYAAELRLESVEAQQWILAMESDGMGFGIGDFGPLYAMRQLGENEKRTDEEVAKWVFSIYYIEVTS